MADIIDEYECRKFSEQLRNLELIRDKAYELVQSKKRIGDAIKFLQYYKDERQIILTEITIRKLSLDRILALSK